MKKVNCQVEFRNYFLHMYSGAFAGMIFLCAIASCIGLASSAVELVSLLLISLTSTVCFLLASQIK